MKLEKVTIENYRAIKKLDIPLDPALTVLHGSNGHGKTSVLSAIAKGLGSIPTLLPDIKGIGFLKTDRRGQSPLRVALQAVDGTAWQRRRLGQQGTTKHRALASTRMLKEAMEEILAGDREGAEPIDLPIVAFYDTDRAFFDRTPSVWTSKKRRVEFVRYGALEGALGVRTHFSEFFTWFLSREDEELRERTNGRISTLV